MSADPLRDCPHDDSYDRPTCRHTGNGDGRRLGLIVCAGGLYQGLLKRSRAIAVVLDSVATRLIESLTMQAIEAAYAEPTSVSAPETARPSPPEAVS